MKKHYFKYYLAASISFFVFLVYLASLRNGFVNWDDVEYLLENPHILSLNLNFLKWAFFDFYANNWHPLTWISHALDYAIWGLNPLGHHLTSNILHVANTYLVVLLVVRLMEVRRQSHNNKISPNPSFPKRGQDLTPTLEKGDGGGFSESSVLIAAGVTGLLFGLHPLHVESVAWVAERKDLLCALFYLLSIMAYIKYAMTHVLYSPLEKGDKGGCEAGSAEINKEQPPPPPFLRGNPSTAFRQIFNKHYMLSLGYFALALMSKPMAVSLPVVLLILDWYPLKRTWPLKQFRIAVIEKLPFIALSFFSSILTIMAQKSSGAVQSLDNYTLSSRVFVAAKALLAYLGKMMLPVDLVPFYPYPEDVSSFSLEYLAVIALPFLITAACLVITKKHKLLPAAWGYYVVTLVPVLGIVQVGGQSMADRYTYLPSLGPFLIAGLGVAWFFKKADTIKKWGLLFKLVLAAAAIVAVTSMTYLTLKQIHIWKNSIALWSYVIEKEPGKVRRAYMNRSAAFCEKGLYDKAIADYDMAVAIAPFDPDVYYGRGSVFSEAGQFDKAIINYGIAINLTQDGTENYFGRKLIFFNRGLAYIQTGQRELALNDFNKSCELGNNAGCQSLRAYEATGAR